MKVLYGLVKELFPYTNVWCTYDSDIFEGRKSYTIRYNFEPYGDKAESVDKLENKLISIMGPIFEVEFRSRIREVEVRNYGFCNGVVLPIYDNLDNLKDDLNSSEKEEQFIIDCPKFIYMDTSKIYIEPTDHIYITHKDELVYKSEIKSKNVNYYEPSIIVDANYQIYITSYELSWSDIEPGYCAFIGRYKVRSSFKSDISNLIAT